MLDETSYFFKRNTKSLNIGTTQTIAGYLLPQCLVKYQKDFPNVSISVHTLQQDTFDSQLANGQLDCIVTNSSQKIAQGRQIFQYPENLVLIAPASCQNLDRIEQFPIIINSIKSCPYRQILLNWWKSHQSQIPQIIELDTVEAILNMVAKGGGISLLPKSVLCDRPEIKSFYIEDFQSVSIYIWIAKNKQPSEYIVLKNILKGQLKNKERKGR